MLLNQLQESIQREITDWKSNARIVRDAVYGPHVLLLERPGVLPHVVRDSTDWTLCKLTFLMPLLSGFLTVDLGLGIGSCG